MSFRIFLKKNTFFNASLNIFRISWISGDVEIEKKRVTDLEARFAQMNLAGAATGGFEAGEAIKAEIEGITAQLIVLQTEDRAAEQQRIEGGEATSPSEMNDMRIFMTNFAKGMKEQMDSQQATINMILVKIGETKPTAAAASSGRTEEQTQLRTRDVSTQNCCMSSWTFCPFAKHQPSEMAEE